MAWAFIGREAAEGRLDLAGGIGDVAGCHRAGRRPAGRVGEGDRVAVLAESDIMGVPSAMRCALDWVGKERNIPGRVLKNASMPPPSAAVRAASAKARRWVRLPAQIALVRRHIARWL